MNLCKHWAPDVTNIGSNWFAREHAKYAALTVFHGLHTFLCSKQSRFYVFYFFSFNANSTFKLLSGLVVCQMVELPTKFKFFWRLKNQIGWFSCSSSFLPQNGLYNLFYTKKNLIWHSDTIIWLCNSCWLSFEIRHFGELCSHHPRENREPMDLSATNHLKLKWHFWVELALKHDFCTELKANQDINEQFLELKKSLYISCIFVS